METQNCKATQFYFGFGDYWSTVQGVRYKKPSLPEAKGPGKVGVQGDSSGDPIRLVGSMRRSGRGLQWLRLGVKGRERGHGLQERGIKRLVQSPSF